MAVRRSVMLTVDRDIAASPAAAWTLLTDVDAWPEWGPSISGARLETPGDRLRLGATGRVYTPLGVALPFVITEFEPGRHWGWTVAAVPATRHRVDAVDGGSKVTFGVPWWAAGYLAVCALALRRIEGMLTE